MNADDKNIKFPDKHYVGFQTRPSSDDLPLGFMTPDGDDAAAKKRKATVDGWANGSGYYGQNKGSLPAQSYENKPMSGFKLGRNIRHGGGWGQGNVKWRIEDPRGFELEITSPNLAQIIMDCTIESGEILEECKWARLRNENILVPVTSEVYKAAQANTARMNKSAKPSDLKLGDTAILQNGMTVRYLGAYFPITARLNMGVEVEIDKKKKHFFEILDGAKSWRADKADHSLLMIATLKLSEIQATSSPLSAQDAERELNKMLLNPKTSVEAGGTSYYSKPEAVTTKGGKVAQEALQVGLEATTLNDIKQNEPDGLLMVKNGEYWGAVTASTVHNHLNGGQTYGHEQISLYDRGAYDTSGVFKALTETVRQYGWSNSSQLQNRRIGLNHSAITDPEQIVITGTTELGNPIKFNI